MIKARYNRVSTANQKLERQLQKIHPKEKIFNDIISGSIPFSDRPQGKKIVEAIENKKINFISVSSIDRLGRNLGDILKTLEYFNDNKVVLRVDNLGIESFVGGKPNQVFKLIISVLGNVAEMERENIRERQLEGIAIAKSKGKYKGRARGTSMSTKEFLLKHKDVVKTIDNHPKLSIRKIAKLCDKSVGTVQQVKSKIRSKV